MIIRYFPAEIDEHVSNVFKKLDGHQLHRVVWLCPNRRLVRAREAQFAVHLGEKGQGASYLPVFATPVDYATRLLPGRKILSDRERKLLIKSVVEESDNLVLLHEADVFIRECKSNLLGPDEAKQKINEALQQAEQEYLPSIDAGMWDRVRQRIEQLTVIYRSYEQLKDAPDRDDVLQEAARVMNQPVELLVVDSFLDLEPHEQVFVDFLRDQAEEVIELAPETSPSFDRMPAAEPRVYVSIDDFQTPLEEIREVVDRIAFLVRSGVEPSDILVVFPELPQYAGVLEREFEEKHIKANISTGRKLSCTPAAALIENVIDFINYRELDSALNIIFNALVANYDYADRSRLLAEFARQPIYLPEKDEHVEALISRFNGSTGRMLKKANELHKEKDYLKTKGFLIELLDEIDIDDDEKAELYEALMTISGEDIRTLKRDFHVALGDAVRPTRGDVADGVQVTGLLESRGQSAEFIFLVGFSDDVFPGIPFKSVFLPERIKQKLGFSLSDEYFAKQKRDFIRLVLSARRGLFISYHRQSNREERLVSRFVREFKQELSDKRFSLFSWEKRQLPSTTMKIGILGRTDEDYEKEWEKEKQLKTGEQPPISVSAILDYLDCPYRFFISNVLGISEINLPGTDFAVNEFGTIVHQVIEQLVKERLSTQAGVEELARAIDLDENHLYRWLLERMVKLVQEKGFEDRIITEFRFDRTLRSAAGWLSQKAAAAAWLNHYFASEREIEGELFGVRIKGIIDLIELDETGKPVAIYDFKTGFKNSSSRYKNQLYLYEMLLEGSVHTDGSIAKSIVWVSEISHQEEKIALTQDMLDKFREDLIKALEDISLIVSGRAMPAISSDNPPGCGFCYVNFACRARLK